MFKIKFDPISRKQKILIALSLSIIFVMMITLVSSASLSELKEKPIDSDYFSFKPLPKLNTTTNYGEITLKETRWYDPLKIFSKVEVRKLTLENNTDSCSSDCQADLVIQNLKKGKLIDSIEFYKLNDSNFELVNFTNYKIQLLQGLNWVDYDYKKDYPEGNYIIRLTGSKKPNVVYDWVITSNGIALTNWAIWNTTNIDLSTGLVAHYKMNDNANSTLVVDSTGRYNGTANFNTSNNSIYGKVNSALSFDGVDDKVSFSSSSSLPLATSFGYGDFSVSLWVFTNSSTQGVAISKNFGGWNDGFGIRCEDDAIRFWMGNGSLSSEVSKFVSVQWNNLIISRKNNLTSFYVNSEYISDIGISKLNPVSFLGSEYLYFGVRSGDMQPLNGSIDDVRIYNRSLTQDEITALYFAGEGTELENTAWLVSDIPANNSLVTGAVHFKVDSYILGGGSFLQYVLWDDSSGFMSMRATSDTPEFYRFYNNTPGTVIKWKIAAIDSDMDIGYTETRQFTMKNEMLLVSSISPNIIYSFGENINLSLDFEKGGLQACWYEYAGINTSFDCSLSSINITTQPNYNKIFLHVNDSFGNHEFRSFSFLFDNVKPKVLGSMPKLYNYFDNQTTTYGTYRSIWYSITDLNLESCWYNYEGSNISLNCSDSFINLTVNESYRYVTLFANDSTANLAILKLDLGKKGYRHILRVDFSQRINHILLLCVFIFVAILLIFKQFTWSALILLFVGCIMIFSDIPLFFALIPIFLSIIIVGGKG